LFTASAEGYLNSNDSVLVKSDEITPVIKNIVLTPIEVGLTVRLKNIYFDFDKTTLKSESFVELNKVVDFLQRNSSVAIEISGHTDSKGSDTYNLNLSQGRSQSVVDYLISQGIDASRLQAQGYGESKPIDTNDTDAGRANNRRVEFTVLKI
jgi:outer membrane protein OmpA-like peptidoglycan-associated protein